jgi:hypothetical protein
VVYGPSRTPSRRLWRSEPFAVPATYALVLTKSLRLERRTGERAGSQSRARVAAENSCSVPDARERLSGVANQAHQGLCGRGAVEQVISCWFQLRNVEFVHDEWCGEFAGIDPIKPASRQVEGPSGTS